MVSTLLVTLALVQVQAPTPESLWNAARTGDRAAVDAALAAGVPVDAGTRYQQTALMFAAQHGHRDIVELLIARGANVNQRDSFYGFTPLMAAMQDNHAPIAVLLLEHGAEGANMVLGAGIRAKDVALVKAALASPSLDLATIGASVTAAESVGHDEILAMVKEAASKAPPPPAAYDVPAAVMETYAGAYRNEEQSLSATITIKDGKAMLSFNGQPELALKATGEHAFALEVQPTATVAFFGRGGMIEGMSVRGPQGSVTLSRATGAAPAATSAAAAPAPAPDAAIDEPEALTTPAPVTEPRPWPGFRGANASGNADGQGAPVEWDVPAGKHVKWKTDLPGFTNASPLVWGDKVIAITAISSANDRTFKTGNYGDVASVEDMSVHTWRIYALDANTGAILWDTEVYTGEPKVKRHTKSSQANATPVTDGQTIVSVFGSIGLIVAHDMQGNEVWRQDIGAVDSGWFFDAGVQWGHSSSPIIYGDTVITQIDQQKHSYVAAWDLATGRQVWKTMREDEIPTWATPTILKGANGDEVVTNGTKVRGYDAKTGELLWTLGPNSEITVGTPAVADGVAYITGGYPPVRTIYAVKAGSRGDLSMPKGTTSSEAVLWSNNEGTYIPSPIVYRGVLYMFNNNGILTAFNAETGERLMRARVGGGGAFSGSPVAADGRLYFASEDGDVFVVKAGAPYREIAKNPVGEVIMSTPAIANGVIYIRTMSGIVAIAQ